MNNVLNTVMLCGRLTADPEFHTYQGQKGDVKVAKYSLALDRKVGEGTDFFPVQAFGPTAVWASKNLHKGTKVIAEGYLGRDTYVTKEGKKVSETVITVTNHIFAESKKKDGEGTAQSEGVSSADMEQKAGEGFLSAEDYGNDFTPVDSSDMDSPWG